MKKVKTITFHSSYNHGSALQAYALQNFLIDSFKNKIDCEIINLRTKRQKDFYDRPYIGHNIKDLLKRLAILGYKNQITERKNKFESFIKNKLKTTKEYSSLLDLQKSNLNCDCLICGSDQIWNYPILDFDWSFLLEFNKKAKKISYAASFGPRAITPTIEQKKRLEEDLAQFSAISVREEGSLDNLKRINDKLKADIHIDPTLLLTSDDWNKICAKKQIDGDYIFLYDLKKSEKAYDTARYLSKKLGNIPVVVVKEQYKKRFLGRNFIKRYNAGPQEFLSYIKNAKIIVSSSFHGNVFSLIFHKPFIAVGGKKDLRINNILKKAKLENRAIDSVSEINNIDQLFEIDFTNFDKTIAIERIKSLEYLKRSIYDK